jgi:Transcriptional regulator, AbiEi antitoxin
VASRVGELFARNGGVATRAELIALGFSATQIRRLLRDGLLVAQRQGVYAPGDRVGELHRDEARVHALRVAAALARTNSRCVASHESAAIIHGMKLLDRPAGNTVVLTHPRQGSGSRTGREGIRIHVAELPPEDVVVRHRVPVTSVARTVADLSRSGSFREGVVVADDALHAGTLTRAELGMALGRCARWPGVRRARDVLAFSDERAESPLESLARVIFHERGLPPPELQVWIHDGYGARIARVDFFWPRYQTIGEADGAMKYEDPAAARRQLARDKKLRGTGYELVHFGWQGIVYDTDIVIGEFTACFGRGGWAG